MGNTHAFYYRLPALFAASFTSCALGLLAISGAVCQFVELRAKEGKLLYIPDATEPPTETETYLGVVCVNPIYRDVLKEDLMFRLSQICFWAAVGIGSFTCIQSWALSSFVPPTEANWKLLGVFAAVSAVLQMPVFLMFETKPCVAFGSEQGCYISTGSLYLILSTVFWLIAVGGTQFLEAPRWNDELAAWRSKASVAGSHRSANAAGEGESQAPLLVVPAQNTTSSLISGFQRWASRKRWAATAELPKNQTDSLSMGEEEEVQQNQIVKYFARTTSRLDLNVLDGKRLGDDSQSVQSFEDLDSIVRMIEEGGLPDSNSLAPPSRNNSFSPEDTERDPQNLQLVVWDNIRNEEEAEKELVKQIYNDLEEQAQPVVVERQIVVASAPTLSPWALPQSNQMIVKVDDPQPTVTEASSKSPNVIKSLKNNSKKKKKSRVKGSRNNKYRLMDDDGCDSDSSPPFFPTEVIVHNSDHSSLPDVSTSRLEFPFYDEGAANGLKRTRSFENEAYPDPIISMGSFESSTDEDEKADPIISSTLSIEMDAAFTDGGDSDSDASTDSSSSGERNRRTPTRDRRRSRRHQGRGFSSVRSVVSSTSLLDTIIYEESDADLLEQEDAAPYDFVRSKSAPIQLPDPSSHHPQIQLGNDHASVSTLGSSLMQHSSAVSESAYDNILLAPITTSLRRSRSLDAKSDVGSYPSGMATSSPDTTFDTEGEDPVESISFSSSVHQMHLQETPSDDNTVQGSTLSVPDDEKAGEAPCLAVNHSQYSQSTSESFEAAMQQWDHEPVVESNEKLPFIKSSSPLSPALTAPETPSPDTSMVKSTQQDLSTSYDSERSWKDERQMRGGIHALPLDESDESSNEGSLRIREARIRRLQREKEAIKRGRAQSHDPTTRRRPSPSAMSSVVDTLDLQLIEVLRPEGFEYGPDEQSL